MIYVLREELTRFFLNKLLERGIVFEVLNKDSVLSGCVDITHPYEYAECANNSREDWKRAILESEARTAAEYVQN